MRRRNDLLLPACGEKVGMRGPFRWAQNRGSAPSPDPHPSLPRKRGREGWGATSPRAAGRGGVGRRDFIALVGGAAAAWPLAARAQQTPLPVIGFIGITTVNESLNRTAAFHKGLEEAGFIEGKNLLIEYRWAEGHYDRFPKFAADLIELSVAVIVAPGAANAAVAAKAATTTIPIVFAVGADPVALGLVASLNRPGGNATGIAILVTDVVGKRLGILHELLPTAKRIAVLVNPSELGTEMVKREIDAAAAAMRMQTEVFDASSSQDINDVFATLERARPDALFVGPDAFFNRRQTQLVVLTARHGIVATYSNRDYVEAGGLMSYGPDINDAYRQVGVYTGRILKGAKPADLPVLQPTAFELAINLQTAKAFGIEIPATLLARADEVIE